MSCKHSLGQFEANLLTFVSAISISYVPLISANVNDFPCSPLLPGLAHALLFSLNELSPVRVWAVYTLYTSHATTWQLFTERSRIYRYLVFGMKFIEFISVVRAIYLVVIFVIAGCSNGNSYTATPPSLRPPHTHLTWLMLNDTKTVALVRTW